MTAFDEEIKKVKATIPRPKRAIVTAGMPYANGPLHIGHLAGAHVPADIYARFLKMLIGKNNVLFVCGTDDHGSTSELAALKAQKPIEQFISETHKLQKATLARYHIDLDIYTGTSHPDCFEIHKEIVQDFFKKLFKNGLLEKKVSQQWFDPKINRFLQDRFVRGQCPHPKCENSSAYSDECDQCGHKFEPSELLNPRSALSDCTPILKDTVHWWLDLWKISEVLKEWIQSKEGVWRTPVYNEVINTVLPSLSFENVHEPLYKNLKLELPKHKSKYAPGKKIQLQFENKKELLQAKQILMNNNIPSELMDSWAHRSVTRDVNWGIPVPPGLDPEMNGKTIYVWPDSLIAPISFTKVALKKKKTDVNLYEEFWKDKDSKIYQFLGQDNIFFYTLMQGTLWIGSQQNPEELPHQGDFQLTDIFGCHHLMVDGSKMSKSLGNFYTGDQLLDEKGYDADQIRYFLAMMNLPDKTSNFEFSVLDERNKFLSGPLNAAFEKPISACHSKFGGRVPQGVVHEKVATETIKIVQKYLRSMERAEYVVLLGMIENYARLINSQFTQFKPHDDRFPEESRKNALYTCFTILKNLMIMLYPFAPCTMDRLRISLKLDPQVFTIDELGKPFPFNHEIGSKVQYFPPASESSKEESVDPQ